MIRAGLVVRFGRAVRHGEAEWWAFPRQADVQGAKLEGLKLSGMKMRTIAGLAEADLEGLHLLDDETVIERLTELPGIGRWTAEWFLARCLGRPRLGSATPWASALARGTPFRTASARAWCCRM